MGKTSVVVLSACLLGLSVPIASAEQPVCPLGATAGYSGVFDFNVMDLVGGGDTPEGGYESYVRTPTYIMELEKLNEVMDEVEDQQTASPETENGYPYGKLWTLACPMDQSHKAWRDNAQDCGEQFVVAVAAADPEEIVPLAQVWAQCVSG